MANRYVARRRLLVGDAWREPGEDIPEAAGWLNLHSYLSAGAVVLVQTDVEQAYGMDQRIPLPPDTLDWQPRPQNALHHDQMAGHGEAVAADPVAADPPVTVRVTRTRKKKDTP
jgi:hypothetical protein